MEERKVYNSELYLVAAFGLGIMGSDAELVRTMNRSESFAEFFEALYNRKIPAENLEATLKMMADVKLIDIDDDPFAGRYISLQKTAFTSQFKLIAEELPDSPIAIILRAKRPWIDSVLANEEFWKVAAAPPTGAASDDDHDLDEIPASDRSVTLLHNSPERAEIEHGLSDLVETLRTSNEVADQLGEERERISWELEAAKVAIRSERIRVGYIKDSVLKTLRELGKKLKEKAIDLGVDKLISLFEMILDHYL